MKRVGYSNTFSYPAVRRALRALSNLHTITKAMPDAPKATYKAIGIILHDRTLNKG